MVAAQKKKKGEIHGTPVSHDSDGEMWKRLQTCNA
jgi:hypothetical protein